MVNKEIIFDSMFTKILFTYLIFLSSHMFNKKDKKTYLNYELDSWIITTWLQLNKCPYWRLVHDEIEHKCTYLICKTVYLDFFKWEYIQFSSCSVWQMRAISWSSTPLTIFFFISFRGFFFAIRFFSYRKESLDILSKIQVI